MAHGFPQIIGGLEICTASILSVLGAMDALEALALNIGVTDLISATEPAVSFT